MKIKSSFFYFLLILVTTSCAVKERAVSSIVNLSSVDITVYYHVTWGEAGYSPIVLSPHQEFIDYEREKVYYIGSHIENEPKLIINIDSITSSLGKVVKDLESESHQYKKGGVPFNKYVSIVRDSSFQ